MLLTLLLAVAVGPAFGAPLSSAMEAVAFLLPLALESGLQDTLNMIKALASAGLELAAMAKVEYLRLHIRRAQRSSHVAAHAAPPSAGVPHRRPYCRTRHGQGKRMDWHGQVLDFVQRLTRPTSLTRLQSSLCWCHPLPVLPEHRATRRRST